MPFGKPKEPKAPKEKKEKKPKPPKKEKPPKKAKPPKKQKPPKKPKKGQQPPAEGEELGLEQEQKKKPIILLLIPIALIAVAAVVVFVFVLPHLRGDGGDDPATVETEEPVPPELPEELMVGDVSVPGMTLEADESGAQAVLAKTVTYTYTNLNDAGKVAETYVGQLRGADPGFSIVDEELVRQTEKPDFTTPEGMVLMARNLPKPESEAKETPAPTEVPEDESPLPEGESAPPEESEDVASPNPEESAEPVEEAPDMVITVRITWSEGQCVVTADEVEGKVTSPPSNGAPGVTPSVGVREAEDQLMAMTPAELGLPGESMADYEVMAQNGIEMVNDDERCIRIDVYNGSTGPNPYEFVGTYLISTNGAHLYRLNPTTNQLEELDFTLKP